jgi:uncharacterized protein involved in exopolysaccharide biosynthesis
MTEPSHHKKTAPLTGQSSSKEKPDRWYSYKGSNEAGNGDAHFARLSERFWSFARNSGFANGEKTLLDVMADLWRARKAITAGALIGLVAASILLALAVPQTRTQMLITPANRLNDSSGAGVDDKNFALLRFIAQRAGVDNSASFAQFENTYNGVSVAKKIMEDKAALAVLKADRQWKIMAAPAAENWSPEKLADYIARRVTINPVGSSSIHAIEYWHPDPALAKLFMNLIHNKTDRLIRQTIQSDAQQRISYLNGKISETIHPEHRRALTDLLLEQERLLMLASIEQPYAATIIEEPFSHYKAQRPNPKLLLPFFMLMGMMAGFLFFTARHFTGKND